jgi:sulfur dioxygenase
MFLNAGTEAIIIDPHISLLATYEKYLKNKHLKVQSIIDTHTHADHFSLAAVLKKKLGSPVRMHAKAISDVADTRLNDGDSIALGNCTLKVMYAPGHTDDSISLYGEGYVFTGDVLLIGSVGRTDFQNGSPESMFDTLQKLKALPDETIVFPAHDYKGIKSSTIKKEKETNPFLKEESKEQFVTTSRAKKLPDPFNIENIVRANQKGETETLDIISPQKAHELATNDSNVKLLDVRTGHEYDEVHIADSLHIPFDTLASQLSELDDPTHTYVCFCRTSSRSFVAADMLLSSGIQNVKVIEGGLTRWQKEKLPVIKGKRVISLERQVRIIAGSLVLCGILLSLLVHIGFIAISMFVGCGLVYAGITDNCMMGTLLMKLPYNKKVYKPSGGTCSISQ